MRWLGMLRSGVVVAMMTLSALSLALAVTLAAFAVLILVVVVVLLLGLRGNVASLRWTNVARL